MLENSQSRSLNFQCSHWLTTQRLSSNTDPAFCLMRKLDALSSATVLKRFRHEENILATKMANHLTCREVAKLIKQLLHPCLWDSIQFETGAHNTYRGVTVTQRFFVSDEKTTQVAVKTLKPDADRHDYRDLMTELSIMKRAGSHPNIVSLLGACSKEGPLYLVMEFVSGGNLLAFLRSNRCQDPHYVNMASSLNERELLKIAEDVAKGMNYLNSLNLVHRDLAARNVLLTEEKVAKVTDFGLARDVHSEGIYTKTTTAGRLPVKWMAPESIRFHIYTTKSDVWSFGVLLWEIITIGECPYPGMPARLLAGRLMAGYRMKKPANCSDELYEVMRACWQLDTEARPTFAELVTILHGFLARTGRGYVNLGGTYSHLDQVQTTVVEMHEFREEESRVTMVTEPEVTHEMDFTLQNEDHLD